MAKKKTSKKTAAKKQVGSDNLERLIQQKAAWLIDKPAPWLRDNPHIGGRNSDGTYNGKELVRAIRSDFVPADLQAADLEDVMQLADMFVDTVSSNERHAAVIRILEGIERIYGAGGFAAVVVIFLEELKAMLESDPPETRKTKPTAEEIRSKAMAEADKEIAELASWGAQEEMRTVLVCDDCGRHRWGKQWLKPPLPVGRVAGYRTSCPDCDAEYEKKHG